VTDEIKEEPSKELLSSPPLDHKKKDQLYRLRQRQNRTGSGGGSGKVKGKARRRNNCGSSRRKTLRGSEKRAGSNMHKERAQGTWRKEKKRHMRRKGKTEPYLGARERFLIYEKGSLGTSCILNHGEDRISAYRVLKVTAMPPSRN